MSYNLSKRLQTIAAFVPRCESLADIGCDHAYLPIQLLLEGKIERAYCLDINPKPLRKARENVEAAGLINKVSFILSDGFSNFPNEPIKSAVIAGMGGKLMTRIIDTAPSDILSSIDSFIFSPQSEIADFRLYLLENGFSIIDEDIIEEDGKYYQIILANPKGSPIDKPYTRAELQFGRILLNRGGPVLKSLIHKEYNTIADLLKSKALPEKRRQELEQALSAIEEALRNC